jgi:transposase-like protein
MPALPEPEELRRLRRENEQLRLEREILKNALGIFTVRSR